MFKKRVYDFYVGGSMRGHKDLNRPMFALVTRLLRNKGYKIWSPSEHDSYLKKSFAEVISIDLNMVINRCRKIALLPGWRQSLGANIEAFATFVCGKESFEVVLNDAQTDLELVPVDLSKYLLPYSDGDNKCFDPHRCEFDSFCETKE